MKENLWNIYEVFITLLQSFMSISFFCALNKFFIDTVKNKIIFSAMVIILAVTAIMFNYINGNFEGFLSAVYPIEILIFSLIFFKSKFVMKIFSSTMAVVAVAVSSFATTIFMSFFQSDTDVLFGTLNIYRFFALILAQAFLFIIYKAISLFFEREKFSLTKYEGVIISGILFSSMLVFILSFEMITTTELSDLAHIILLVINFIFVLIDAFAMHFVFAQSKVNMIKYENEQFKKMELLKVNYVDNLKANYDEIHRLKHDMKNVINGVMSLIYENKSELAAQKLNEFRTDIEKCEVYVNTDNVFVNTVLNLKISDAKEQNIKVVYKIAEDLSKYNDLDLCYILGNLLDNAIEACKKCSEPFIDISIEYINSRLNITIKNSVNTSEPITFKTSKADKTNHGIGLKSVKMTVDKYEGELDYYSKGNTVVVFVLL